MLKGPAVSRWLYREDEVRGYSDIDLLVPDPEVGAAERILKGLGFERHGLETIEGDWPRYARNWVRSDSISIDLHQTLAGVGVPPATLWRILTEGLEKMTVAGVDVDVLAPPGRALALALHTAKDGPRIAKARHDLGHAIDRLPPDLWIETARLAERGGGAGQPGRRSPSRRPFGGRARGSARTSERSPFRDRHALAGRGPRAGFRHRLARFEPGHPRQGTAGVPEDLPPVSFIRAWSPLATRGRVGPGCGVRIPTAMGAVACGARPLGVGTHSQVGETRPIGVYSPCPTRIRGASHNSTRRTRNVTRPILPYHRVRSRPGRRVSNERPDLQAARRARSSEASPPSDPEPTHTETLGHEVPHEGGHPATKPDPRSGGKIPGAREHLLPEVIATSAEGVLEDGSR